MTEADARRLELANLVAVIERAAADLALAEEPARFAAALEAAPPEATDPAPRSDRDRG
ncbi:MAG TPA: hypothetical protein VGX21_14260 [Methylomirabilota bacterium]|jgi:hypothetical protein|nr:hypothetical protein [Methylomirabilota bacterium]